jgi:hypothetical protein
MVIGMKVLEKFEQQLADPEFKVGTRDMVAVASMVRQLAADARAAKSTEEVLVDDANLDETDFRQALRVIERLEAGNDDAPEAAAAGASGAGED